MQVCRRASIPHFKITAPFSVVVFFEYLKSRVTINKIVKEHAVDSHMHSHISMDSLGLYLSEYLFSFLSNLYIPPWLGRSSKFMVFRLPEK